MCIIFDQTFKSDLFVKHQYFILEQFSAMWDKVCFGSFTVTDCICDCGFPDSFGKIIATKWLQKRYEPRSQDCWAIQVNLIEFMTTALTPVP